MRESEVPEVDEMVIEETGAAGVYLDGGDAPALPLTARAIAFGAFAGVTLLTFALLGAHALFTYIGLDDGGAVKELLTITVGGVMTLLGMVGAKLFGSG